MKKILHTLFLIISIRSISYSQGCNDAGFCTIGDMKPAEQIDTSSSEIGVSTIFRLGEKEIMNTCRWLINQVRGLGTELQASAYFISCGI